MTVHVLVVCRVKNADTNVIALYLLTVEVILAVVTVACVANRTGVTRVGGRRELVVGDEIAVLIELCFTRGVLTLVLQLVPEARTAVSDQIVGLFIFGDRVANESSGLVLPSLNALEFLERNVEICVADSRVGVCLVAVDEAALTVINGFHVTDDDGNAAFLAECKCEVVTADRLLLLRRTVPNAVLREQLVLRENGSVIGVTAINREGREDGSNDRVEDEDQNNDRRDDRALVLTEANERVLEIANRLGFELTVEDLLSAADKLELFLRYIHIIILLHHFLDPILILGSINP